MLIIFESILPIFLLVMAGVVLRRVPMFEESLWSGLERLSFYVIFPAYMFLTLADADYSGIDVWPVTIVYLSAIFLVAGGLMAAWPLLRSRGVGSAQFTSLFQTTTRWNGFVALAIAERIADKPGLALVAFLIGVIIIPINMMNVAILIWFGDGRRNILSVLIKLFTNPMVLSSLVGITVDALGIPIYAPVATALDLVGRCALGIGLLIVGAGLHLGDVIKPRPMALLPVTLKLMIFPATVIALAFMAGIDHQTIVLLALASSVPTAMNGYLLAKQMGGDAPLYAAISTLQTAVAFLTMPAILALVSLI